MTVCGICGPSESPVATIGRPQVLTHTQAGVVLSDYNVNYSRRQRKLFEDLLKSSATRGDPQPHGAAPLPPWLLFC